MLSLPPTPFAAARIVLATEGVAEDAEKTIAGVCGASPQVYCRWVYDTTGSEYLATFAGTVLPTVTRILLIALGAWLLSRLAKTIVGRAVARAAEEGRDALRLLRRRAAPDGTDEARGAAELTIAERERASQRVSTIGGVLASLASFAIWTVAIIMILADLGVNVGPLIAGAGIVGVALGFGAQSLVADFLSGTFMLLEDQYGIGDVVDVGEATGTVEGISLRVTRLRDVEGTVWHVPNGEIRRVGNMSQLWSRSLLDVGVAYDTDLDQASAVITDVASGLAEDPEWSSEVLEEPSLWGVEQFGANEIVLRLVIKVRPASQWKINREFRRRLKLAFDEAGIEIPFPQRTIWMRGEGVPAAGIPAAGIPAPPEATPVEESPPEQPPSEEPPSDDAQ